MIQEKTWVNSLENLSKMKYRLAQNAVEVCQPLAEDFKMKALFRMRDRCESERMPSDTTVPWDCGSCFHLRVGAAGFLGYLWFHQNQ